MPVSVLPAPTAAGSAWCCGRSANPCCQLRAHGYDGPLPNHRRSRRRRSLTLGGKRRVVFVAADSSSPSIQHSQAGIGSSPARNQQQAQSTPHQQPQHIHAQHAKQPVQPPLVNRARGMPGPSARARYTLDPAPLPAFEDIDSDELLSTSSSTLPLRARAARGDTGMSANSKYRSNVVSTVRMACTACEGRGHTLCPKCSLLFPDLKCPLCGGWGFNLCAACRGEGALTVRLRPRRSRPLVGEYVDDPEEEDIDEDDGAEAESYGSMRKNRAHKRALTEEHKAKIRASMAGRNAGVPLAPDHRDRIAATVQKKMRNPEHRLKISLGKKGQPLHCSKCGKAGHNSRRCPLDGKTLRTATLAQQTYEGKRPLRCGVCGALGHNRLTCPHAKSISIERDETLIARIHASAASTTELVDDDGIVGDDDARRSSGSEHVVGQSEDFVVGISGKPRVAGDVGHNGAKRAHKSKARTL
eukprot:jgi/Chlat1/2874/Chrsp195S00205